MKPNKKIAIQFIPLLTIIFATGCGGGGDDSNDEGNTVVATDSNDTDSNDSVQGNENPSNQNGQQTMSSEFSEFVGIWDTSLIESDAFGASGIDEQYLAIREDGTAATYDYQDDGFGSGFNCYSRDTLRLIPETTAGSFTFLPDDPEAQRAIINLSATTNFLNIFDVEFGDSRRAERETQFLTESEFVPLCTVDQENSPDNGPEGGGGPNIDESVGGSCIADGSVFDWGSNCPVSQSENAVSSYATAIQGVLWCQGFGSGTRDEFVDGRYGPITESAVISYQESSFGFAGEATGIVDSETWSDLQEFGLSDVGSSRFMACDDIFFEFDNNEWFVSITGGIFQSMSAF